MEQNDRGQWGSRFGFIMAAAGSAVGLGNIWRFPYLAGENGGGAFILLYLVFVALIGMSVMLVELGVGRMKDTSAVGSFKAISKNWTFVGVIGVLAAFLIMGFYPVIGGWSLAYVIKSLTGLMSQVTVSAEASGDIFGAFVTDSIQPLIWTLIFLAFNIFVVIRGVQGGIEAAGKILMPMLFILLGIIIIYGLTLPGAGAGLAFLFQPDFSKVTFSVVLSALGQAFFSLSLGMGCMITYGSYLSKDENLPSNAGIVTFLDTLVAIMAGLAIFPALFALGGSPQGGTGLVFIELPRIFASMGGVGTIFSTFFFLALFVAALTSSVSLLEVATSYFIDERKWSRARSVITVASIMAILCILSSLSVGAVDWAQIGGVGVMDILDLISDKVFMAIGGVLIAVFAGWVVDKNALKEEVTNNGKVSFGLFEFWFAIVKYVVPFVVGLVAIVGLYDKAFSDGVMTPAGPVLGFGLLIMLILGLVSKKL